MTKQCTWEGCEAEAKHTKTAIDNSQWAHLCDEHNTQMDAAVEPGSSPGKLMAAWVKAQGGSKAAARRMRP